MHQTLQSRHPLSTIPFLLLFLILSFSFSLVAITNTEWVQSPYLDPYPTSHPVAWYSRGPFGQCSVTGTGGPHPSAVCEKHRSCDQGGPYQDLPFICQQVHFWAGWLVTGAVFAGLSMLTGFVLGAWLLGRRWRRVEDTPVSNVEHEENIELDETEGQGSQRAVEQKREKESRHHRSRARPHAHARRRRFETALSYLTALLAVLSVLFLATSVLFLLQFLTNDVSPDADFTSNNSDNDTNNYAHWTWKTPGVAYAFLSWLFNVVALLIFVPFAFLDWGYQDGYERLSTER
ncbi:hypothetical protein ACHAPX_010576 [Trichoderma viride]